MLYECASTDSVETRVPADNQPESEGRTTQSELWRQFENTLEIDLGVERQQQEREVWSVLDNIADDSDDGDAGDETVVVAHTGALRDYLPAVAEGEVARTYSDTVRAVAEAARACRGSFTAADVRERLEIDTTTRTVRRHLAALCTWSGARHRPVWRTSTATLRGLAPAMCHCRRSLAGATAIRTTRYILCPTRGVSGCRARLRVIDAAAAIG